MTDQLTHQPNELATILAGRIADEQARLRLFADYRERKAPHTVRRQRAALRLFGAYLAEAGLNPGDVSEVVEAWRGLSAHDCRHTWATLATRSGTPLDRLQDAGGWASPTMPLRYIEVAKIANQGVRLE